jgi:AraC-like DNA-binding protein
MVGGRSLSSKNILGYRYGDLIMEIYDMRAPELFTEDLVPDIVGYYYRRFTNEYIMFPHRHKQVEIMYVERGECIVEVEKQKLPMEKGEFVLINGDVYHRLLVEKGKSCKILNIEFVFVPNRGEFFSFGAFCRKISDPPMCFFEDTSYYLLKDIKEIYWLLKRMVTELDGNQGTARISTNLLFWQLMLQIIRILEEERLAYLNPQVAYVRHAIHFIHKFYHKNIKVEDIATEIGLNRSYFHRIFKEYAGMTPVEYLTRVRISRAKNLLVRTNLSMVEVAQNIGMGSQQYFTYLFKKETGVSPGEFKKRFEVDYFQREREHSK